MRSKAPLALMVQMVMVLVFALAAALCLRVFALSDQMSRRSEARDDAVILAQNAAEICKHSGGDFELLERTLGGEALGYSWTALYGENLDPVTAAEDAGYEVVIRPEMAKTSGLGRASVSVFELDDGELLFQIPVSWQEEVALRG